MVLHIDADELTVAWRALAGQQKEDGWQTIAVAAGSPCRILAGRRFPGNEEAILVGFLHAVPPKEAQLPEGKGFQVKRTEVKGTNKSTIWYSLVRQPTGSTDMFSQMAADVILSLGNHSHLNQDGLLQLFLKRIRAWQNFMQRSRDGLLSPEEEVGLVGELTMLRCLIGTTLPHQDVVEAWQGPLYNLHDFTFGNGAIEVKATIAKGQFLATISSIDQLDEGLKAPLFLAAIRLGLDDSGKTLPEYIQETRELLKQEPDALGLLEIRLLQAGYLGSLSGGYSRRFVVTSKRVISVQGDFPRIVRGMVSGSILDARYQIDLDHVSAENDVEVDQALTILGVI